jgi:metal-responsive CopG/Arc/MetJ family transcriptional regulator
VRKHPVSIALSNRVLEKIDKETMRQKRSRSDYVELLFENIFFKQTEPESEIVVKTRQIINSLSR